MRPSRATMSPLKVRAPTTIQGSRQIGTTTRAGGARPDAPLGRGLRNHPGSSAPSTSTSSRRSDPRAWSTDSATVTHTGMPAARSRSTSTRRFSSWLATTRSGSQPGDGRVVGVLRPPHPGHVEPGRMGAPVGGPHQPVGHGDGQGLGERRDEGHHPARGAVQHDAGGPVVLECRHAPPRPVVPTLPRCRVTDSSSGGQRTPSTSTPSKRPASSGRPGGSPTSATPWPPPPRSCGPSRWCWPRWTGPCARSG